MAHYREATAHQYTEAQVIGACVHDESFAGPGRSDDLVPGGQRSPCLNPNE